MGIIPASCIMRCSAQARVACGMMPSPSPSPSPSPGILPSCSEMGVNLTLVVGTYMEDACVAPYDELLEGEREFNTSDCSCLLQIPESVATTMECLPDRRASHETTVFEDDTTVFEGYQRCQAAWPLASP